MILAYFHPFGLEADSKRRGIPTRKPLLEVFRANILLDSKIDRYGVHIDARLRDKRLRSYFDGTAWLEEAYASVDILRRDSRFGPLALRVGKTYSQFGRFFDYQFIGSVGLRDGLKIDPNYGVSLDGTIGAGRTLALRYVGQYFVIDGGMNTSIETRDTISNPAPLSGYPQNLARKRNMFVGRLEPIVQVSDAVSFRLGGSVQNFTSDFGPTLDQENVFRYGADIEARLAWFGAWAEYIAQHGVSTRESPFSAAPAINMATDPYGRPSSPARPARFTDQAQYVIAGARLSFRGIMLRYHYSQVWFDDVTYPIADIPGVTIPSVTVKETMHTAGLSFIITPQLSLWIEVPIWRRYMDGAVLRRPASAGGPLRLPAQTWLLDQQVVVTLHATI